MPDENANIITSILKGEQGARREIIVLNAAAGIQVGQIATSFKDGIKLAEESIDSGNALKVLDNLKNAK
jgi:anthranilate phosphoribosyltransferase